MNLVHNERTKLLATALNNTAVATVVTALIAPAVNVLYRETIIPGQDVWWILVGAAWLLTGTILHLAAQRVLGELRE